MKSIKIIITILSLSVIYQFAEAQPCNGNKVRMSRGSKGGGCTCQKKCVDPSEVATYQTIGWYIGECPRICFNGFKVLNEDVTSVETAFTEVYPNPASGTVTISFTLSQPGEVTFEIFDLAGRYIGTIAHNAFEEDGNEVIWDASGVNQGFYFLKMTAGNYTAMKRISVVK